MKKIYGFIWQHGFFLLFLGAGLLTVFQAVHCPEPLSRTPVARSIPLALPVPSFPLGKAFLQKNGLTCIGERLQEYRGCSRSLNNPDQSAALLERSLAESGETGEYFIRLNGNNLLQELIQRLYPSRAGPEYTVCS